MQIVINSRGQVRRVEISGDVSATMEALGFALGWTDSVKLPLGEKRTLDVYVPAEWVIGAGSRWDMSPITFATHADLLRLLMQVAAG